MCRRLPGLDDRKPVACCRRGHHTAQPAAGKRRRGERTPPRGRPTVPPQGDSPGRAQSAPAPSPQTPRVLKARRRGLPPLSPPDPSPPPGSPTPPRPKLATTRRTPVRNPAAKRSRPPSSGRQPVRHTRRRPLTTGTPPPHRQHPSDRKRSRSIETDPCVHQRKQTRTLAHAHANDRHQMSQQIEDFCSRALRHPCHALSRRLSLDSLGTSSTGDAIT